MQIVACGGNNGSKDESKNSLTIKGTIGKITSTKSFKTIIKNSSNISKVLVYRDFGEADISPVNGDGTFSVNVNRSPCGLVFLDNSNFVVGYLSLAEGLEALPLTMVDENVGQIDLKDITIEDGVGTPDHNPLEAGGEIQMTAEELAVYKLQSSLFSAIIRNLDMNSDGTIDVLSDRPYWLRFGADFAGGVPATSDPGSAGSMPALSSFHFNFSDYHTAVDSPQAMFEAPDGTLFTCHEVTNWFGPPNYHWVLQNTDWDKFLSGDYAISYDSGKKITFNIISPLNSDNYIVAADLWYETDGIKITRVHWKWKMLNGTSIDATKLIKNEVGLQFNYDGLPQINYHVTSGDAECAVNVNITSLRQILMSCNDLFGN